MCNCRCEAQAGTAQGEARNVGYANIVRWGTVKHSMIDQIKNPSTGFEEVIENHFRIKKTKIMANTSRWVQEAKDMQSKAEYTGACRAD